MAFTDEQILIVTLLTDIHAKLGIDDGLDPDFVQEMVTGGNTWALRWRYSGLFEGFETPPKVKRVAEVLEMWEVLERTVSALSAEERDHIDKTCKPFFVEQAKFEGYCGNNEDEFSITHILVEDLGRFSMFKGRDFNAHMPKVAVYDRMFKVYSQLNPLDNFSATLTADDFAAVLKAQAYPSN